jgi:hypothetical protein
MRCDYGVFDFNTAKKFIFILLIHMFMIKVQCYTISKWYDFKYQTFRYVDNCYTGNKSMVY